MKNGTSISEKQFDVCYEISHMLIVTYANPTPSNLPWRNENLHL